jgi:predicted ATPase
MENIFENVNLDADTVSNKKKAGRPLTSKERKDVKLRVLLSPEEEKILDLAAQRHGKNKSEYIRYLISLCK